MSSATESAEESAAVKQIERLVGVFSDRAEEVDRGGPMNSGIRQNIHQLQRIGFFGAGISKEYGGLELSHQESRSCLKKIAAACGVTAFTQQQLHAGGNFVGLCHDETLKKELLPLFASGENICGVGFSHLRRSGPPKVKADRTLQGFDINGVIPWISAWSLLDSFIIGATLNDGSVIFAYLPIREFQDSLFASTPMELSTMGASETVEVSISDLKLPGHYVLSEHLAGHMARSDFRGISGHTEMPLGCALGSAGFIRTLGLKWNRPDFIETALHIEQRADEVESEALIWNGSRFEEPEYKSRALAARAGAITLALNAAAAGIAALGGSAHLLKSPAQRRFRESAFYMTQAQTTDVQHSLLEAFIDGE